MNIIFYFNNIKTNKILFKILNNKLRNSKLIIIKWKYNKNKKILKFKF